MKYYNCKRVYDSGCEYNFIFGGRSNGKSYSVCKDALFYDWYTKGIQFGRVCRYESDMKASLLNDWFPGGVKDYIQDITGNEIIYEHGNWFIGNETVGFAFSLFNQHKYKSSNFPKLDNLVFEEFVPASDLDYLPNEINLLLSLVSTICRHRSIRVWFIGNVIKKHNIYFDYFGIDVDKMHIRPGDIRYLQVPGFTDGARVCVEYAEMSYEAEQEIPRVLRVTHNEIATTGEFADDEFLIDFSQYKLLLKNKYLKHIILFRISLAGKMYFVHSFTDGKKTFNVVTHDGTGSLSSKYIYYINPEFENIISRNAVSKDFILTAYKDAVSLKQPTFYTDNTIAYFYGMDVLDARQKRILPPKTGMET